MKLRREQQAYAAHVLRQAPRDKVVVSVRVNAQKVTGEEASSALGALEKRVQEALGPGTERETWAHWADRVVTRQVARVGPQARWGKEKLDKNIPGARPITAFMNGEFETVTDKTTVEVDFADGTRRTYEALVVDMARSASIKNFSRAANAAGITPIVGFVATGIAAVAAAIWSAAAVVTADWSAARARGVLAAKLLGITVIDVIPVIGEAMCAMAMVADNVRLQELRTTPLMLIEKKKDDEAPAGLPAPT